MRWMVLAVLLLGGASPGAAKEAAVGKAAPDFTTVDTTGTTRSIAEFRGRFLVLEWFNPQCPFVGKHYGSGNMQQLQRTYTARGVAWLSVDSSAPGKQGHVTPEEATAFMREQRAAPTAVLLDPDGRVGRLYGATATPHLFVINPDGILIYAGAIDDTPSTDPHDIAMATNYVAQALDEAMAGRSVSIPETRPYGCSVKY